jgi:autotransporter-associated beta strand protein
MKTASISRSIAASCVITGILLFVHSVLAANDTWVGNGADANWATIANWAAVVAPVNNDTLAFNGTTQQINTNNISNLSVGSMTFSNGGFNLSGNALTVAGVFTDFAGINTISMDLTDTVNNTTWNIASGSELQLAGAFFDNSGTIPLANLSGAGTLRITSTNFVPAAFFTQTAGAVIFDGAVVSMLDGYRLRPGSGITAVAQFTNNGSLTIGLGGNLRLCQNTTGGSSRVDMSSGTLNIATTTGGGAGDIFVGEAASTTTTFNQNGGLVEFTGNGNNRVAFANASASANGTYNLNGGLLWTAQITQVTAGSPGGTFNFNGGTLKPTISSTTFFQGVQAANIQSGGAIIDTTNLNITIGESLPGVGGLTKLGTGNLTLSGANTYAGSTVVSNGTLNVTGNISGNGAVTVASGSLAGSGTIAGAVSVQSGATLSPGGASGAPVILTLQNNLTLSGNLVVQVNKSLALSNDLVAVGGTLTNAGTGTLTLANLGTAFAVGDSFSIFSKPLPGGGALTISPANPGTGMVWVNRLALDGTIGVAMSTVGTAAQLSNLALSAGILSPAFTSNNLSYTASVPYTNGTVTITATSMDADSSLQIIAAGATNMLVSGAPSSPISLNPGADTIDVRVTSSDGTEVNDYIVTMTRVPPNVILILADDQGFSDWSCYGSEIQTPNLDSLAATGLRFRNFHNAARCSPTRCSILTGLYTQQAAVDPSASLPPLRTDNNVTIAEVLGASGYHTYMAGKWHIGSGTGQAPEQRGFDEVFTYISGTDDHEDEWTPSAYRFATTDGETTNIIYSSTNFYQPDAIGDYCLQFLNNQFTRHTNQPFFMYIPFGSAHFLIQAPQAMADTNALTYSAGWDFIRNQRYTNMLAQGVIDSRYALSPNEGTAPWSSVPAEPIPAWSTLDTNRQADLTRRMALYAAMIQKMDANIGRVVQYLQQNGQLDNTLIIALSDNGGNYEGGVYGLYNGVSDAVPVTGTALESMGQSGQPSVYIGGGWAHVSNTPFRWFKHFDHFGGIGTPFIVHWPQGLTRTNQWEDEQGHLIDVMATIVDVTGATYPTLWTNSAIGTGYTVLPMQGISLKPWFTTNLPDVPRNLGFEHEGNRAYISGNWNLVTKNFTSVDGSYFANELELYDLSKDPSQVTNLAYTNLTVLAQMVTNWNNWCTYVGDPSSLLITSISNPAVIINLDPAPDTNDLFVDTFDRPDNTNIQASATGMWGSLVPPMGANAAYYEGYDAQYLSISNNTLYKGTGGMVESGLINNFTGQDILTAGGFSVELNVVAINSTTSDSTNRYVGFGVGLTQAQAASGGDIYNALSPGQVVFRGAIGGNTGVSPFFVDLNLNGDIEVWTNGVLVNTVSVGGTAGILTASFACTGFTTNDPIVVNVFFNGQLVNINPSGTNSTGITFYWQSNNNNYIGLSARASNYAQMDNLAIRKLPLVNGLVTDYAMSYGLTGTNTAPNADPDGDGVSNLGEWAFGGDPAVPDSYIAGFQGIQVLPGNDFRFEFQRYINYAAVGLQYHFLVSTDLLNWTEITPTILSASVNEDKTDYEVVTMELPTSVTASQGKLFLRIYAATSN